MSSETDETSQQAQTVMEYLLNSVAKSNGKIVTDDSLIQKKNAVLEQLPLEAQHEGQKKVVVLMVFAIIWWRTKCADDLKQAPLAVAREFLKAEHDAYVRKLESLAKFKEQLVKERKELDAMRKKLADEWKEANAQRKLLADEKRQLLVDQAHFMVEKKIIRARHEALVKQASVPVPRQQEKCTFTPCPQQEGSLPGERQTQERNIHAECFHFHVDHHHRGKRTLSDANLDETSTLPPQQQPHLGASTAATEATPATALRPVWANMSSLEAGIRMAIEALDLHLLTVPTQGTIHIPSLNHKLKNVDVPTATVVGTIGSLLILTDPTTLTHWRRFERQGKTGQWYCWYGLFNYGEGHDLVADGKCVCQDKLHIPGMIKNHHPMCMLVRRSERTGLCSFTWRQLLERVKEVPNTLEELRWATL
ncbi:hypothetical protein QBC32DRAFT_366309 [Pseudoneurospora amorphoporcata]|uniref:Uncharacterized protein n=1 Tax=Pseudoneurospora amorphoporcata TaxID=241081 RepID=A0AAN6NIS2_9PEZI|nr:hypothetical protein QBC32DRAFT_366309 [Pseudoneurospora amorphoporcata]